ncbi:hypothetical protein B0H15DRAFT_1017717 [Mycena belliarum]|uniref:Uncharacterized protein n=1 Tax=Mycena belliarum TaxID=1033014 RepID=A0AAD6ULA4_9AGAR|nr:hypothetical protein B0H15DRAFT_1017717 [Mycena belliae]
MSAAARAEARRKAILSRGTDRLAKLTTSGRGEDSAVYAQDVADPPLPSFPTTAAPTANFLGEETPAMPRSRPRSRMPSAANAQNASDNANANVANPFGMPDPSAWSQDQQAQFLQALMGGAPLPGGPGAGAGGSPFAGMGMGDNVNPFAALMAAGMGNGTGAGAGVGGENPFATMGEGNENPFGAMLGPRTNKSGGAGAGMGMGMGGAAEVPPKTRAQRLMPALHLAAVWALLAYFVVVLEPRAAGVSGNGDDAGRGAAWRWRQLSAGARASIGGIVGAWGVQVLPFFWAFATLELALHSLRIFSGFDAFRPPMLIAIALPHLPPPIPAVIVHGMKYFQMGSLFLDDVAAVIVGVGLVVWLATWRAT